MNSELEVWLKQLKEDGFFGIPIPNSVSIFSKDLLGSPLLHIAAIRDCPTILRSLVEAGVDIDTKAEHGYTALHEAVEQGNAASAKVLLELGASKEVLNDLGLTPLDIAIATDQYDLIAMLKSHYPKE